MGVNIALMLRYLIVLHRAFTVEAELRMEMLVWHSDIGCFPFYGNTAISSSHG